MTTVFVPTPLVPPLVPVVEAKAAPLTSRNKS